MKVSEVMTRDVRTIKPDMCIRDAAQLMEQLDTGALLVEESDKLIGMITDRDITIRAVARDCDSNTSVRKVMSEEIKYCFEDEDINHVAENMADIQVRRLPVVNRDKRLVGVVSLGNIACSREPEAINKVVSGVTARH